MIHPGAGGQQCGEGPCMPQRSQRIRLVDAPAVHCCDTEFESECFDFSATRMGSRPALAVYPMTSRYMQPVQQDEV